MDIVTLTKKGVLGDLRTVALKHDKFLFLKIIICRYTCRATFASGGKTETSAMLVVSGKYSTMIFFLSFRNSVSGDYQGPLTFTENGIDIFSVVDHVINWLFFI